MQSKYIACLIFILTFGIGLQAKFKDIPNDHWAEKSVNRLVEMGITSGYQDGTFKGRKSVSRYELALYLSNLAHYVDAKTDKKSDNSAELLKKINDLNLRISQLETQVQTLQKSSPKANLQ